MKSIKLNKLAKNTMEEKEMHHIKGGHPGCSCSCYYEGNGGSSVNDNGMANYEGGLNSPIGKIRFSIPPLD
ncbi:MAG: TIGR04149 family rSAM-modified RiPP [Prevotellaceae bacterium]|jgi:natural product precursor|nr:TIGR04149 family rSAM-modified RiPP [Prevotellaceae bacterium]